MPGLTLTRIFRPPVNTSAVPFVLPCDAGQARLGLAQPLLEQARLPGRVHEPAAQRRDLLLKEGDLRGQDLDLVVRSPTASVVVTRGHAPHPLLRADLT